MEDEHCLHWRFKKSKEILPKLPYFNRYKKMKKRTQKDEKNIQKNGKGAQSTKHPLGGS